MPENIKTAFVIEDDKDICNLLSILLKSSDIEVFQAHSLTNARLLPQEVNPSMIFIDHWLPDGGGFSYIPDLQRKYPLAKIIAMSAQTSGETMSLILQYGVNYFLEKPFRINELKELISKVSK